MTLSPNVGLPARRPPYVWSGFGGSWRRRFAGRAFAWPWFDNASAWVLRRFFLPASRLWAAAGLADGSAERFYAASGLAPRRADDKRLDAALARFEKARARAAALEHEWQRVFFGPDDSALAYRSAVEAARLDGAHAYNAARRFFAFLLRRGFPPIRLNVQSPSEVAAIYGAALVDSAPFVAPPDPMPAVERSRSIPGAIGVDYWLRFKSPSARLNDVVYTRVHEPHGAVDPPTLIFGHGVCVEFDQWRGLIDEADTLCAAGFRVIRPEAPWHGRRTPRGAFAGERLITTFPMGLLDGFFGALQEWAVLADWARKTSRGALAFGGTSLGALTAQLAADRDGPARLRPDGLFLITHCGRMANATAHGEMTRIFGAGYDENANGWTPERIGDYIALLDPRPEAPIPPDKIVSVLGSRDRVTPFRDALPLVQGWGVPANNIFIFDRGHFSMPMTLIRNKAPVERFCAVMQSV